MDANPFRLYAHCVLRTVVLARIVANHHRTFVLVIAFVSAHSGAYLGQIATQPHAVASWYTLRHTAYLPARLHDQIAALPENKP